VELTRREFDLLAHLMSHPRLVFTRGQLLAAVWQQPDVGDGRTIDVHVARLRNKLGAPHRRSVATVRGIGYKFDPAAC
jgi:DNA-binding response OmpR family regulator